LPEKVVSEMTYTVLGGTLDPTHSLTLQVLCCELALASRKPKATANEDIVQFCHVESSSGC